MYLEYKLILVTFKSGNKPMLHARTSQDGLFKRCTLQQVNNYIVDQILTTK